MYVFQKKISCTHLEYLKKDLKKKKNTQILEIKYLVSFFIIDFQIVENI